MPATERAAPGRGLAGALLSRTTLLLALSFGVMADPVPSAAYAIEAALRTLNGDLALLVPTMGPVVAFGVFAAFQLVVLFIALASAVTAAAGSVDRELVLFYAVSVFLSFLAGLLSMALFSHRDGRRCYLIMNIAGAAVVAFTLIATLPTGLPRISLAAALIIAAVLYGAWVRAGRPGGIRNIIRNIAAEAEEISG